jgi:hypothetical protein
MAKRTAAQRLTDLGNTLCSGCVVVLRPRSVSQARGWVLEAHNGGKKWLGATEEEATEFLENQILFYSDRWGHTLAPTRRGTHEG